MQGTPTEQTELVDSAGELLVTEVAGADGKKVLAIEDAECHRLLVRIWLELRKANNG